MLGDDRFAYPENHIEADNRLSWLVGRLDKKYADNAIYVHLKRNANDTARSLVKHYSRGIMKAYSKGGGILLRLPKDSDPIAVALDYCNTVNSNIELLLRGKTHVMEINLEEIDRDFATFWETIGAEGDLGAALAEFSHRYNAAKLPKVSQKKSVPRRVFLKVKRMIAALPGFIKNV
jgi:hypothetical protein